MATDLSFDEPTADDLAAIDVEMPLIEAEIAVLDAEIRILTAVRPAALDWRRLRRAEQRVMREATELVRIHRGLRDGSHLDVPRTLTGRAA
ncbi:DUF6284 family protein [Rugosimonospora africana]|uniref:Uncharacterized protein n=1 Tax=Rugosimonospora africana TaxID=556532 RepID=A0A8J3R4E0_9ACTN|nr:DUF6284 family protein [Rugosimonospora africana]GIH21488.1 hypothetical protein Raf01_96600 [Rugosimonospora africana]